MTWLILGIVVAVIVVFVLAIILLYNGLVGLRNQVKNAWAQIEVQLKRRYDLIPNLVETVKSYAKHEKDVFESVTKARNLAQTTTATDAAERGKLEGQLSSAISRLLVVAEAYPDLKASKNFLSLQEELTATENRISFSRQYYNDSVLRYNNKTQMFPSVIIAGLAGFKTSSFFVVELPEQREVPKVSFS
ncbi:MAG: LemA family protein [Dehalococcoidia bacterium]|nr:LemA family protein [Dehalococcoidia bacterium]